MQAAFCPGIAVPDPDTKKKGPTLEINRGGEFISVDSSSASSNDPQ